MKRAVLVATMLLPALASAQAIKSPEELERIRKGLKADTAAWGRPEYSIGPKLGVFFGDLPFGPNASIDFSYAPNVMNLNRQLLFGVELSYQHSSIDGAGYEVGVNQIVPMGLVSFHPYPENWPITPYAGLGLGFCAMRTATEFRGNGTRTESELRLAQAVLGGLQIRAGSAAFEIEARYVHSTSGTQVLKDSSIAPIAMTIGYRIPLR